MKAEVWASTANTQVPATLGTYSSQLHGPSLGALLSRNLLLIAPSRSPAGSRVAASYPPALEYLGLPLLSQPHSPPPSSLALSGP